jgi:hypothetical protein
MPAFALLNSPPTVARRLQPAQNAPLPLHLKGEVRCFGTVLEPRELSAHVHLTSELLRTLSMNGCF